MSLDFTKHIKYLPGEEWRWVPGKERLYAVSSAGRVVSFWENPRGKFLKQYKRMDGYKTVRLGRKCHARVHRLVASAFLPNPSNKKHVHHKDGNPSHNAKRNLEWCTPHENTCHFITTKYAKNKRKYGNRTISPNQVISLLKDCRAGIRSGDLCVKYGISRESICNVVTGKRWSWLTGIKPKSRC